MNRGLQKLCGTKRIIASILFEGQFCSLVLYTGRLGFYVSLRLHIGVVKQSEPRQQNCTAYDRQKNQIEDYYLLMKKKDILFGV